jgi:alanyl-tRNA synthetase
MGEIIEMEVNLDRREKLRRLHTATHILNYCARKILGNHIWQNGSNLKSEFGTLDITHYQNLSREEIFEIEKLVNETIFEDRSVYIEELDRNIAEKKYGFQLYQGGAIPMKKLRIVHVESSDIEACGGIHMEKTGGIGLFKIIEVLKIQDGVIRVKFTVRDYALEEIKKKEEILFQLQEIYSVEEKQISKTALKFFNEWKEQKKQIEKLKDSIKEEILKQIGEDVKEFEIKGDYDMAFLMEIFSKNLNKSQFKLKGDKFIIASSDFLIKEEYKKVIDKNKFKIYII